MTGPRVELDRAGNPVFVRVPTPDVIRLLKPSNPADVSVVHDYLRVFGLENPASVANFERQYLSRFNITPSSPDYREQLRRLSEESYSDRVAVAMSRRTAQQADTMGAMDGNLRALSVYINDGPDPCPQCEKLNGLEMTYIEFAQGGMLPGDRCLGGDNCLCILQSLV